MKHKSSEKKGYQNVRNREMFVLWRGVPTQVSTLKNCLHKVLSRNCMKFGVLEFMKTDRN